MIRLSAPRRKYGVVSGEAFSVQATREEDAYPQRSVTDEQRSLRRKGPPGTTPYLRLGALSSYILAFLALAAFPSQSAPSQTRWRTVDQVQSAAGQPASAGDIGTDFSGTALYAVGSTRLNSRTNIATIRVSRDAGKTWTTSDMFLQPGAYESHFRGFGAAPSGSLFACGDAFNGSGKNWVVRQSIDNGATWFTADQLTNWVFYPSAGDVKAAPSGEIYVAGTQADTCCPEATASAFQWLVRKSSDDGGIWQSMDVLGSLAPFNQSEARAIAFRGDAVFVVGYLSSDPDAFSAKVWTVRRSLDKGETWTTVDAVQLDPTHVSSAEAITVTPAGHIIVVGSATAGSGASHLNYWLVRRSTNGGESWETIDTLITQDSGAAIPDAVTSDQAGNIWVCGYSSRNGALNGWFVSRGTERADGTVTWSNSDFVPGQNRPNGLTSDRTGRIFVTGRSVPGNGVNLFTTRVLEADAASQTLEDAFTPTNPSPFSGLPITVNESGNTVLVSWPHLLSGATLEFSDAMPTTEWKAVPNSPIQIGDADAVLLDPSFRTRFFRLRER